MDGLNGSRPRQSLRKPLRKHDLNIATWNVRTMLKPGKMIEIANQMKEYKIDLVSLQEVRWQNQGRIDKKEFTFLYSGPERRTGLYGTGFMITSKLRKSVLEFEPINDRLCRLRLKGRFRNLTCISAYAPTEESEEETKEEFYEHLETLVNRVQEYDMLILLGDFNAQIGKEECLKGVAGEYTIHDATNDNGTILTQFASRNNLIIKSTCFPHKRIHLGTWKAPGSGILSQIDHVITKSRHSSSIIDVRSCRGPNCDSDHFLVKAVLRDRVAMATRVDENRGKKWDSEKLKNVEKMREYQIDIEQGLNYQVEEDSVEERWERMKEAIDGAAERIIGERRYTRNGEWWDEECMQAMAQKNNARARMLQCGTRNNTREYKRLRKRAEKICRRKKRAVMKGKVRDIENLYRNNEMGKYFKAVNKMRVGYVPKLEGCKDKEGNIIGEDEKILERWKEHFSELLNQEGQDAELNIIEHNESTSNDPNDDSPSQGEIEEVVMRMKNSKAPGEDGIMAELFKHGGTAMMGKITELVQAIWRSERMPDGWRTGVICPIHKKGDKRVCENYRGITLLNVAYKIVSGALNNRISRFAETVLGQYQCGFRSGRGTTDQIFVIRQIMEKFYEHGQDLHFLFIDYKQAFDSINRSQLLKILYNMGIPSKLARLTAMTMKDTIAKVKIGSRTSMPFNFNKGVKQGDGLSAVLFNLALHVAVEKIDQKDTVFLKSSQICAYADDIVIIARNLETLKRLFRILETESLMVGLKVNQDKTKYLRMSSDRERRANTRDLIIDDQCFQAVSKFRYLGTLVTNDNCLKECIKERILAGNRAYYASANLFKSKLLSRSNKLRIYKSLVRPVVTYASEAWTMTLADESALRVFERRVIRRICGPVLENNTWRIRHNHELEDVIQGHDIVRFVKSQRLRWLGHIQRMPEELIPKKVFKGQLYQKRRSGRPRKRWIDGVKSDLVKLGVRRWQSRAEDREDWRTVVEEAKAHHGL